MANARPNTRKRKEAHSETQRGDAGNETSPQQRQLVFQPDSDETKQQREMQGALNEGILADHLQKYLDAGDSDCTVYHSILGGVHVYCYPPSKKLDRPFYTLVTMGMSGTRMKVPKEIDDEEPGAWAHAELMCYLPADWEKPGALGGPITAGNWPVEMLRSLVNYVQATGAWLAESHGIPSLLHKQPGAPFHESTQLSHCILLATVMEKPGFSPCMVSGTPVHFYLVVPLTAAEAGWKRRVGAQESIFYIVGNKREAPDNVAVDYVIDSQRPCAVDDLKMPEKILEQQLEVKDKRKQKNNGKRAKT